MVLKITVLGGIKPVVWWFLKKRFFAYWCCGLGHGDTAICPCCGSLGRYSLFVGCCLDSDDVEALADGQFQLVKWWHGYCCLLTEKCDGLRDDLLWRFFSFSCRFFISCLTFDDSTTALLATCVWSLTCLMTWSLRTWSFALHAKLLRRWSHSQQTAPLLNTFCFTYRLFWKRSFIPPLFDLT